MNPDGHGERSLTSDAADTAPAWSPDGTRIAFASTSSGNTDVWVMDADGSDPVDLTDGSAAADTSPSWSPDGTHIAFQTDRDGNDEIYVMDADGGDPTNLTSDPGDDSQPAWSPDGDTIAFVSDRDGNDEVYAMDASDGSGQTDLTNDAGRRPRSQLVARRRPHHLPERPGRHRRHLHDDGGRRQPDGPHGGSRPTTATRRSHRADSGSRSLATGCCSRWTTTARRRPRSSATPACGAYRTGSP